MTDGISLPARGKLFIKTHGCQMNEYDSSKMLDVLKAGAGVEKAETPEDADILLMNTCSIREKAQEKVFSELGRWRQLKEIKPGLVIAIEPWFLQTTDKLYTDPDGWTLRSGDGSRGAHMEHTIAITADGPLVLTARE